MIRDLTETTLPVQVDTVMYGVEFDQVRIGQKSVCVALFDMPFMFVNCLLRASEFTENIDYVGKHFTLSEFLEVYDRTNMVSFGSSVFGINLSRASFDKFYEFYGEKITMFEESFRDSLPDFDYLIALNTRIFRRKEFLLTLRHELSHALYNFDFNYREVVREAFDLVWPAHTQLQEHFTELKYTPEVIVDEFAAHVIDAFPMPDNVLIDQIKQYYSEKINQQEITRINMVYGARASETLQRDLNGQHGSPG